MEFSFVPLPLLTFQKGKNQLKKPGKKLGTVPKKLRDCPRVGLGTVPELVRETTAMNWAVDGGIER